MKHDLEEAKDLALSLGVLENEISPAKWEVKDSLYSLIIQSDKPILEDEKSAHCKPIRNIAVLASTGVKKSDQKRANARFICLTKNNLSLILKALNKYILTYPKQG